MRSLGLKSQAEWFDYSKSSKRPDDIPSNPWKTYKDKAWIGIADWLGSK